ncbi:carbohydrate ABC transporter permease [Halalkalibacter akibai]|uniref:Binding-protein-dependent transport systems inner membrane component n=1 Tax=Halalkalibacter akibai (strain ATCC 43226 / DSM 21942 / CIP 109018 / JCM 9157 / 1139) TaxID=1236973 RepID=W4QQP3_HALA3|nr:carbohydrate ABC transporter permease [Halalkalibacter akibai]GAE33953.1 binding-protein-dependent transport systems inner membrane component [Halalkalibacter akibai JCM 9157]
MGRSAGTKVKNFMAHIFLSVGAVAMLGPLVWMLSTSLKNNRDTLIMPPKWIPDPFVWTKYIEIWEKAPLHLGFINSLKIAIPIIVIGSFATSLAAFAFAKMKFKYKQGIFLMLLATMMIPFPVVMIPQFLVFSQIGWIDTLLPLVVPAMLGNVFMLFFLRQYLNGISDALIEAAKIDGSSMFGIYWKIILPIIQPAIAAQVILWFIGVWNDYLGPLIYIFSREKMPIQLMIANFNAYYAIQNDFPLIMAASLVAMVPIIIVFVIFQRQIIESVAVSGIKG